jgi:hypothetical protein
MAAVPVKQVSVPDTIACPAAQLPDPVNQLSSPAEKITVLVIQLLVPAV